jgi:hypothetical protein
MLFYSLYTIFKICLPWWVFISPNEKTGGKKLGGFVAIIWNIFLLSDTWLCIILWQFFGTIIIILKKHHLSIICGWRFCHGKPTFIFNVAQKANFNTILRIYISWCSNPWRCLTTVEDEGLERVWMLELELMGKSSVYDWPFFPSKTFPWDSSLIPARWEVREWKTI